MRSRRLLHVAAMVAAYGVAAGQPQPKLKPGDPKPAGSSATESSDVPEWKPGPAKFAVAPFENHATGVRAFDWLVAGAPFEIAEKTEAIVGLDPTGGPLFLHDTVAAEAPAVAAYAAEQGAADVITRGVGRADWGTPVRATVWGVPDLAS